MELIIKNVNLVLPDQVLENAWLLVENEHIAGFGSGDYPTDKSCQAIDGDGGYLSPGFVDTHVHGAGGFSFNDENEEAWLTALRLHLKGGTTTILPTFSSSTHANFLNNIAIFNALKEREDQFTDIPRLAGLHLEGPYFAVSQCGAQDTDFIRDPVPEEYEQILQATPFIKRWSIACERPGALPMGRYLAERGICASIGHSDATWEQAIEAVEQGGYSCVTHLYSSCSSLHRNGPYREGGVVEAAFLADKLDVEMISDGVHLPPLFMQLIYKIKGADHIAMVTDCVRAGGMDYTEGQQVWLDKEHKNIGYIENEVCVLGNKKFFAGSIATTSRLVRTAVKKAGIALPEAVRMAALTPARMLGLDREIGSIALGKRADLVLLNTQLVVEKCFLSGRCAYSK